VRVGRAVATLYRHRALTATLAFWKREWHLSRRFVRLSPPRYFLPHQEQRAARRAFLRWRYWRWVYVHWRACVSRAFSAWYLRGRAIQLAVPTTKDGREQSPFIFWTGAGSIRGLLYA